MAGLNFGTMPNYSGVFATPMASYGSASSYASGASTAAFAGMGTQMTPTNAQILHPGKPFGLTVWVGIAAIAGLAFIRYSLPN